MLDLLGYGAFFLTTALTYGIMCLGLNLQWGQTGLFNVGVAGFVAIGAYASALLTTPDAPDRFGGFDLPIVVGWLGAMVAAGLASLLVGAVTLRLRADYLAITTFGVAISIQLVALNVQGLTGGPFGIAFIPRPFAALQGNAPPLQPRQFSRWSPRSRCVVFFGLERLVRGPWGRVLRAIREDEAAAAALGKNARVYRLQAFVLGGALMGLAGAMQGHFIGFIAPDNYLSALTFQVWAMLIVGGAGNNRGAARRRGRRLGPMERFERADRGHLPARADQARAAALQIVLIGVLLAVILLLRPRGLLGERIPCRASSARIGRGPRERFHRGDVDLSTVE